MMKFWVFGFFSKIMLQMAQMAPETDRGHYYNKFLDYWTKKRQKNQNRTVLGDFCLLLPPPPLGAKLPGMDPLKSSFMVKI